MSEISRYLAIARTVKHFGVSEALAEEMLREEFPPQYISVDQPRDIFADDISLYAGGSSHGYVHDAIDEVELADWLGQSSKDKATGRKKADRPYEVTDAPLLEEMRHLIESGQSRSVWNAAGKVVHLADGSKAGDSAQRRLQRAYDEKYGST